METERSSTRFSASEEELYRGYCYRLLARLLGAPGDDELMAFLRGLEGDDTELGRAIANLAEVAHHTTVEEAVEEYETLFIGVTEGELIPFGSYYQAGALNEKPLSDLRSDMNKLGIARTEGTAESEDHIASLFEIMEGMITGAFGKPVPLAEQYRFFDAHVGCWAPVFFDDLEAARSARLYMPVGRIGKLFMNVEKEAFTMAA